MSRAKQTSLRNHRFEAIEFELRRAYGRDRFYPMNGLAASLVLVSGRVCFEQQAIEELKAAGFHIVITQQGEE